MCLPFRAEARSARNVVIIGTRGSSLTHYINLFDPNQRGLLAAFRINLLPLVHASSAGKGGEHLRGLDLAILAGQKIAVEYRNVGEHAYFQCS